MNIGKVLDSLYGNQGDKTVDNVLCQLAEAGERWENRLSRKGLIISKAYREGRLQLMADFEVSNGGQVEKYLAIFKRVEVTICEIETFPAVIVVDYMREIGDNHGRNEGFMFVCDVEIMDGSKQLIPSYVWLKRPDFIDDLFSGSVYVSLFDHILKATKTISKREINPFRISAAAFNEFCGEQVQRCSQVMNDISYDAAKFVRGLFAHSENKITPARLRVSLMNNQARFSFRETDDIVVKLNDMLIGPLNL